MLRLHNEICWREFNDGPPGRMVRIFLLAIAVSRTTCGSWLDADATKESQTDLLTILRAGCSVLPSYSYLLYAFLYTKIIATVYLEHPPVASHRVVSCRFVVFLRVRMPPYRVSSDGKTRTTGILRRKIPSTRCSREKNDKLARVSCNGFFVPPRPTLDIEFHKYRYRS